MSRYVYSSYCTVYRGSANGVPFPTSFRKAACFGNSLAQINRAQNDVHYTIVLVTDHSMIRNCWNNYCWMTKHQLENYLRRIASIMPFKYKVYNSEFEEHPCYKIDLAMHGSRKQVTFVLQCIKRCYEFPFNYILLHAYEMQKLPAFKFDSILNLFNVVFSTYYRDKNWDHCFSGNTMFEKYATLRERMPRITAAVQLYPDSCNRTKQIPQFPDIYYSSFGAVPADTDQWTEDLFRRILPKYIENYQVLKR